MTSLSRFLAFMTAFAAVLGSSSLGARWQEPARAKREIKAAVADRLPGRMPMSLGAQAPRPACAPQAAPAAAQQAPAAPRPGAPQPVGPVRVASIAEEA